MTNPADPSSFDTLRHQIDSLTPQVGELSRADVVTWCLINYMAGARDLFAESGDGLAWSELSDPVTGELSRREIAAQLTAHIDGLIATTQYGTVPGLDPNGRTE